MLTIRLDLEKVNSELFEYSTENASRMSGYDLLSDMLMYMRKSKLWFASDSLSVGNYSHLEGTEQECTRFCSVKNLIKLDAFIRSFLCEKFC